MRGKGLSCSGGGFFLLPQLPVTLHFSWAVGSGIRSQRGSSPSVARPPPSHRCTQRHARTRARATALPGEALRPWWPVAAAAGVAPASLACSLRGGLGGPGAAPLRFSPSSGSRAPRAPIPDSRAARPWPSSLPEQRAPPGPAPPLAPPQHAPPLQAPPLPHPPPTRREPLATLPSPSPTPNPGSLSGAPVAPANRSVFLRTVAEQKDPTRVPRSRCQSKESLSCGSVSRSPGWWPPRAGLEDVLRDGSPRAWTPYKCLWVTESQTGAGAVGRPSARGQWKPRGGPDVATKEMSVWFSTSRSPEPRPLSSSCPPGAGNRPGFRIWGRAPTHRSSPLSFTLVPPGEVSEVVQDSAKSSLWVGDRTRTRNPLDILIAFLRIGRMGESLPICQMEASLIL